MNEWYLQKNRKRDKSSHRKYDELGTHANYKHTHCRKGFKRVKKNSWSRTRSNNRSALCRDNFNEIRDGATVRNNGILKSGRINKKGDRYYHGHKLFGPVINIEKRSQSGDSDDIEIVKNLTVSIYNQLTENEKGTIIDVINSSNNKYHSWSRSSKGISKEITKNYDILDLRNELSFRCLIKIMKKIIRQRLD